MEALQDAVKAAFGAFTAALGGLGPAPAVTEEEYVWARGVLNTRQMEVARAMRGQLLVYRNFSVV